MLHSFFGEALREELTKHYNLDDIDFRNAYDSLHAKRLVWALAATGVCAVGAGAVAAMHAPLIIPAAALMALKYAAAGGTIASSSKVLGEVMATSRDFKSVDSTGREDRIVDDSWALACNTPVVKEAARRAGWNGKRLLPTPKGPA